MNSYNFQRYFVAFSFKFSFYSSESGWKKLKEKQTKQPLNVIENVDAVLIYTL